MNEVAIQNFSDFVMVSGSEIVTDSRKVAVKFRKSHAKVLRTVRQIISDTGEWGLSNFGHTHFIEEQNGQEYDCYQMTKDGFMFLVMGFTGKAAIATKIAFIQAFNAMAEHIKQGLWRQALELECRDASSKVRASIGSRLMLARKKALPTILRDRTRLNDQMQIKLPLAAV